MVDENRLIRLQREMRDLEKEEMKLRGSLDTFYTVIKKDLGNLDIKNEQVIGVVQSKIGELKKKRKKAKILFTEKMEQIEKMSDFLGDLNES